MNATDHSALLVCSCDTFVENCGIASSWILMASYNIDSVFYICMVQFGHRTDTLVAYGGYLHRPNVTEHICTQKRKKPLKIPRV